MRGVGPDDGSMSVGSFVPGGHKEMSSILADPNSALVYEGEGGLRSCGVSANEYSCHGAQTNFVDITPYLTYVFFQCSTYFIPLLVRESDAFL